MTNPGARFRWDDDVAAVPNRGPGSRGDSMKLDVQYAWNGDVAIAYQVLGDGPHDLLIVMGYLSNLEYAWQIPKLAAFYERLASFSRLIIMDRPARGYPTASAPARRPRSRRRTTTSSRSSTQRGP